MSRSAVVSDDLATPQQVAEFMHTTQNKLAQDRYLGVGLPYVKHGRRVLYRWSAVHQYLEAHTIVPGGA